MDSKPLSSLLGALDSYELVGSADPLLTHLVFDSREAGPGCLFFALPGTHTDGHNFLEQVHGQGCRAFVVQSLPPRPHEDSAYLVVPNSRWAMSPLSAAFYRYPSREVKVIGVTGTDGKSSTVSFIFQLLTLLGHKAGFFSTVEFQIGSEVRKNALRQSTPEAPQIHRMLREMADLGCTYAVLESTSHGLSEQTNRLGDVAYQAGVFTNVTTEHLEFHKTLEEYRRAKTRLFSALDRGREGSFGVVNLDDPYWSLFAQATGRPVLTYSQKDPSADLRAQDVVQTPLGLEFTLCWQGRSVQVQTSLHGTFNVSNLLAALLVTAQTLSLGPLELAPYLTKIKGVRGRMTQIKKGQPFEIFIDYAHTPGAFSALLPAMKEGCHGRLMAVFGSGGERDEEKRPQQGALADQFCDLIFLTDEDPRQEDPQKILQQIAEGIKSKTRDKDLFLIRPRRQAIFKALSLARAGDRILLLGKGHESSIVTAGGSESWDEYSVTEEALKGLGWI